MTFVSIILLAVYPESLQPGDTLRIFPNDTILAVPNEGLDPSRINYVLYKYFGVEESQQDDSIMDEIDRLFLYKLQCNSLRPQSREIDIDESFTIPDEDYVSVFLDHQYFLNGSSINYQINITLASDTVPPDCYAELVQRDEQSNGESVEICNSTSASLPVEVTRDGYILVALILNYGSVKLKAIDIKISGTLYYYDAVQSKAELACEIDPLINTKCSIPIRNNANQIGSSNICILAERESSITGSVAEFEYYMESFSYGRQVILITLICVGLVLFVCMCGLSISLCTKPGRRLKEALH